MYIHSHRYKCITPTSTNIYAYIERESYNIPAGRPNHWWWKGGIIPTMASFVCISDLVMMLTLQLDIHWLRLGPKGRPGDTMGYPRFLANFDRIGGENDHQALELGYPSFMPHSLGWWSHLQSAYFSGWLKHRTSPQRYIEDPFDLRHNLASACSAAGPATPVYRGWGGWDVRSRVLAGRRRILKALLPQMGVLGLHPEV
jgi:hypothetical protein